MILTKNKTEDSLLSFTKICETLVTQIHRKPEQTIDYKLSQPRETFHCNPPISIK